MATTTGRTTATQRPNGGRVLSAALEEDDEVLAAVESAGIPRERILGVDRDKIDEALNVLELSGSAVYEIEEREYVRKAEVDEEVKETASKGSKID